MRTLLTITLILLAGAMGYAGSSWHSYVHRERVVAMSWGDGQLGKQAYGAKVILDPDKNGGFAVRTTILIGQYGVGSDVFRYQDCGTIGHTKTPDEAVQRYGTIVWKKDGLHIGDFFLKQADFEHDR